MELFPHGKVNLSLYIGPRQENGYHQVDTLYWPLPLFDYLRVEKAPRPQFFASPPEMMRGDNLVLKAWELMRREYPIGPVRVHLDKTIPWEAGLGGGSGDAAAMLYAINRLFGLGLSLDRLMELAGLLGADVPAGLLEEPARGLGTGASLRAFSSPLRLPLLIIKPPQGFSTRAMYGAWDEKGTGWDEAGIQKAQEGLEQALKAGAEMGELLPFLHNDFESVLKGEERAVFEEAVRLFEGSGALKSLLCGSGSAVFGLYASEEARQKAREHIRERLPKDWRLLVPFTHFGKLPRGGSHV